MYQLVTIFSNTLLYIWKFPREKILKVLMKKTQSVCDDGC